MTQTKALQEQIRRVAQRKGLSSPERVTDEQLAKRRDEQKAALGKKYKVER